MKCFIKDRYTFVTSGLYEVSEYDIYLKTIFDDKSKLTINTGDVIPEGDIVYCDNGWLGVIDTVTPDKQKKTVKLTCTDIINLFDENFGYVSDVFNSGNPAPNPEDEIWSIINNYQTLNDYPNLYSYLSQVEEGHSKTYTPPIVYPDLDKYMYNAKDFMLKCLRLRNVFTEFSVKRLSGSDVLRVDVEARDSAIHNIDFSDSSYVLVSETYSNNSPAMVVCCVWYEDTIELVQTKWYVYADGTVSTDIPDEEDRVSGIRKVIYVSDTDDQEDKVLDEVAKYKYSHKIEFSTTREMDFYDLLHIRLNGRVLNSYISSVRVKSDSNRFFYTSGEMRTSLTDKIKELI